jgi:dTDP-4-amino-4,6-dideoxy-D-galactose acyltransferase
VFQQDPWLSGVLEIPCYRMTNVGPDVAAGAVSADMADCAPRGRAFFAVKQRADVVASLPMLTQAGFNVIDVGVTLDHAGNGPDDRGPTSDVTVSESVTEDEDAIADLAGHCFSYSRFHADPQIGTERANTIKREWARNSCHGRAARVYVAKCGGEVAGFLAVLTKNSAKGVDAVIDLIGVDAAHQGHGIGSALSLRFIRDWRERAIRLRVGTQAVNIPALRLYESLGFRISETAYALHAHLHDGNVVG